MGISDSVKPADTIPRDKKIFIWVDILGFSEKLANKEYEESRELLISFREKFQNIKGVDSIIIGDGIILMFPCKTHDDFTKIINKISNIQLNFILEKGHLIRGGIAMGETFKSNDIDEDEKIISDGVAKAVKLESNHICWPIIGTNLKELKELKKHLCIQDPKSQLELSVTFNSKGEEVFFIDFLNGISNAEEYHEYINNNFQNKVKGDILLAQCPSNIKNKHIWLLKHYAYHFSDQGNKIIGEMRI